MIFLSKHKLPSFILSLALFLISCTNDPEIETVKDNNLNETQLPGKGQLQKKENNTTACNDFFDFKPVMNKHELVSKNGKSRVAFKLKMLPFSKFKNLSFKEIVLYIDNQEVFDRWFAIKSDTVYSASAYPFRYDNLITQNYDTLFSFSDTIMSLRYFHLKRVLYDFIKYKTYINKENKKVVQIYIEFLVIDGPPPEWEIKELHFTKDCGLIKVVAKNNKTGEYYATDWD